MEKEQHSHEHGHHHDHNDFTDYTAAVKAYRETFASKAEVMDQAPDPAVREMVKYMDEQGVENCFDRFDKQKPHCTFGLAGVCCRICSLGPCKITERSPRGTCGANADLIVARNLVRAAAGGVAAHGARAREVMLTLKKAAAGEVDLPILGKGTVRNMASAFGLATKDKSVEELANEIADILLEDMSRTVPGPHKTLDAVATPERRQTWEKLGLLPVGSYHEVFEALHQTTVGTQGDWRKAMDQFMRLGIAFSMNSVVGGSIASDCLYGTPKRTTVKANLGALKTDTVNIAIHGHAPMLATKVIEAARSDKFVKMAEEAGAAGIQFYGICCSGLSSLYRLGGVIPLSNANGSELVLATGALDLWLADIQEVFPGIMDVADCYKTVVVTTNESNRLPGAEHIGYRRDLEDLDKLPELADRIVARAIESFANRRDVQRHIPAHEMEAEVGFSLETLDAHYGCMERVASAIINGQIKGIINLAGCTNTRVVYEKAIVEVVDILLKNNVLVFTNGCASFPMAKLGYCSKKALNKCGEKLQMFLRGELPPVWHFGECIDNAHAVATFREIAGYAGHQMKDMPFAEVTPEWSNEKGVGAALAFRMLGFDSYHCVHAPVQGSEKVRDFLYGGTRELLGSSMKVDTDPKRVAAMILADFNEARSNLCWR
ncbi:anaerobic carbon-monoxide dehydrogenase catalytic subunit [Pseudodesulfovibrio indicus]|uniref:anaerobic carbon-monoxide dehydrogenase n=1 Tax=Pseudodesulfovibrio indicus TaxID=1716143 RepID=A0A126QLV4_9BACT|nr:anaerobic carbon-monoxide dehydrogenase catalytic subunit [Pseudodesulfovibrio indicus]AMK10789.1 carbon monoxide dehydrogenase [Pseudodesulfovibrio indicus]TDT91775.1 carbon-monoxide dehydrogenase catalytic subunit [Pseudodesulfovibrio indicus]